jgi:Mce-associated membrane protein
MEGDAGTSRLNPTDEQDSLDQPLTDPTDTPSDQDEAPVEEYRESDVTPRRAEKLGRGWVASIAAALLLAAAGVGVGGYLALKSHDQSEALARAENEAVAAAKDCVAATQAPDTAIMSASQAKIINCSTGDFGAQAALYSGVLADAYQAANVKVQVTEMRTAVEGHNDDGTVDVMVAMRIKVSNLEVADQEQGYRLRAQMAPEDGTYKISKLEQVTS